MQGSNARKEATPLRIDASRCCASTSCLRLTPLAEWIVTARNPCGSLGRDGGTARTATLDAPGPLQRRTSAMTTKAARLPQSDNHAATAVLQVAERLHAMNPEWVVFFREVLGVEGIVRRTFSDPEALMRFECSPQYARIREMLDGLRARQSDQASAREAQRVVTVRMPRSLHETLKSEADEMRVSVNTLCISKLMKLLDEQERRDMAGKRADAAHDTAAAAPRMAKRTGADL